MEFRYPEIFQHGWNHIKVAVYKNLHKDVWSVKALEGPLKGKVILYANTLILRDAEFRTSEAGRQKVLKEKRKNVHSTVVGYIEHVEMDIKPSVGPVAYYNPYKTNVFIDKETGAPLNKILFGNVYLGRNSEVRYSKFRWKRK